MVIVEAMAMGRPVLSTPVGISPEILDPPRNGLMTDGTTTDDLVAGLRDMLDHRDDWPAMGAAARQSVEGFTARSMARRHEALYDQWLAAGRRGAHDSAVCAS